MAEPLTFIAYASRAAAPFDHDRLVSLLTESRSNNERDGITGMLVYRAPDFIQMLEGPDAAVRALLGRIADDPRHTDVRVLLDEQVSERRFSMWSMGYEPTVSGDPSDAAADALRHIDDADGARASAEAVGGWFRDRAGAEQD